jgi:hypothetical protein
MAGLAAAFGSEEYLSHDIGIPLKVKCRHGYFHRLPLRGFQSGGPSFGRIRKRFPYGVTKLGFICSKIETVSQRRIVRDDGAKLGKVSLSKALIIFDVLANRRKRQAQTGGAKVIQYFREIVISSRGICGPFKDGPIHHAEKNPNVVSCRFQVHAVTIVKLPRASFLSE